MMTIPASFRAPRILRRVFALGCALAVLTGAGIAAAQDRPLEVRVAADWLNPGPEFEGWGTALAWFGHVTGRFPDQDRSRLADLLFGRDGLGLNIARYNIGGGNAPEAAPYLRPGADVPGFWRRPPGETGTDWWRPDDEGMWDWSADRGQRWWLDAIKARVPEQDLIFEAFSNSPPYFMTRSGRVSGNEDGLKDNLRPGFEPMFAEYLVRVVAELERRHAIRFRTISPVNEPNTPYWFASNTQEGAHWSPQAQSRMFTALAQSLKGRGVGAVVSGPDETNALTFAIDWAGLSDEAKAAIGQINVHSYESLGKSGARDIAQAAGKRFWMSEVDLSPANVREDFDDMRPALALAEQIIDDINTLRPQAWVLWQAVENVSSLPEKSSNWGLIKTNYANLEKPEIHISKKYWAFGNFTKFVSKDSRFFPNSDGDTLISMDGKGDRIVIVSVNPGIVSRRIEMQLPRAFETSRLDCEMHVTTASQDLAKALPSVCAARLVFESAPASITTTVINRKACGEYGEAEGRGDASRRKGSKNWCLKPSEN